MTKTTQAQADTAKVPEDAQPFLPWIHDDRMSCRQVAILLTVRANPGLSTGKIASLLKLNKPTVTRTTDKLEQMRLIRRLVNTIDRRKVELWPIHTKGRKNV